MFGTGSRLGIIGPMKEGKDWLGAIVGILVFLLGIALLSYTFFLAFQLFSTPPEEALGMQKGQVIDLNASLAMGIRLLFRVFVLLLMCFIASLVANRGIKIYGSRTLFPAKVESPEPDKPEA